MRRLAIAVVAIGLSLGLTSAASAQYPGNYNLFNNSFNGYGNQANIYNGGGYGVPVGPVYPQPGYVAPFYPRTNVNEFNNSFNGIGNRANIYNGGFGGGYNINRVNGSFNGAGNYLNIWN